MAPEGKKNSYKGSTGHRSAGRSKQSSSGKSGKSSGKTGERTVQRNQKKKDSTQYELQNEIFLILTLVVSVLLLLSDFNLGGVAGSAVNKAMFGLFGILAYLFPVILFLFVAFYLANRGNKKLPSKLVYIAIMFLMLLTLSELLTSYQPEQWAATEANPYIKPSQYFTLAKTYKKGGGFFGGLICFLFEPLFGKVGTFVVVLAVFIICFMLFSRKALFRFLANAGKNRYALHKVHAEERRELYEEKQAEKEKLVEEKRQELSKRRAKTFLLTEDEKYVLNPEKDGAFLMRDDYTLPEQTVKQVKTLYKEENKQKVTKNEESKKDFSRYVIDPVTGEYLNTAYKEQKPVIKNEPVKITVPVIGKEQKTRDYSATNPEENRKSFGLLSTEKKDLTVAEQLMALGGQKDRATSAGQAFFETQPKPQAVSEFLQQEQAAAQPKEPEREPVIHENSESSVNAVMEQKKSEQRKEPVKTEHEKQLELNELKEIGETEPPVKKYVFPPVDLLTKPKETRVISEISLQETAMKLQSTLDSFGVHVTVTNVSCGPAVTRYELLPEQGVKVSRITSLADDIKLNLAAADVRIEAPIPGKAAVGIEVPNKENSMVLLRELLESKEFKNHSSKVAFAVGKDIGGQTVVTDIAKMPHLLIAGATGSGKSVCINTLIMSIIYKADPADVKLIMVDPKVVELSVYNGIPHLMIPVVTDPKKASAALNWAVMEMTERYQKFAELSVRDIKGYNERVDNAKKEGLEEEKYKRLPQIIIIVDELADLMMVAPGEVEDSICRLAQLARAAGLHLVIATQRPSVNVITGLIKANIPSRIAFAVSSAIDSRTILDGSGAEKLLGKGDMLFFPSGYSKPIRVQGAFVSDHEVSAVVDFLKEQNEGAVYSSEVTEKIASGGSASSDTVNNGTANENDEFFEEAGKLIIEKDKASIGMLQRAYKIGFNRAARIMDQLCEAGVVGPDEGTKPRKVLMTEAEFSEYLSK